MEGNSLSRIAYNTINPMRFVQDAPGIQGGALQCSGAGVPIIGIAAEWVQGMPGTPWQTSFVPQMYPAAASGNPVRLYGMYDMNTMVIVGSGVTVVPGQLLVSDASGNAVGINLAASGNQWIGARAIEGGVAGNPIRCEVYLAPYYH
jgi:hypothetical protein